MGITEIARLLGVSRQRAHQLAHSEDFPEPVAVLAAGPIWETTQIEAWAAATGRSPRGLWP
jgi:predicted DNA-binding transcriptional regulator AlpA